MLDLLLVLLNSKINRGPAMSEYHEPWAKMPISITENPNLNDGEIRTLLILLSFKEIWISQSALGKRIHKDRGTIIRHYQSLEKKGFILKEYRKGRTCRIKLTSKCRPAAEFPQGSSTGATEVDKLSSNSNSGNKVNDDLLEIFMININSYPQKGQRDKWLDSLIQLEELGMKKWQIMEMSFFIKDNNYWHKRILSPLDLLTIDKNGVPDYLRLIRQAGIEK